jgi:microsomal dipeptidase-like Zn-dependent dipeptidase
MALVPTVPTVGTPNIAPIQQVSSQPTLPQPASIQAALQTNDKVALNNTAPVSGTTANLSTPVSNTTPATPLKTNASTLPAQATVQLPPLVGWVDLHTHPMSNLAFAGKLFHGGADYGSTSLMPGIEVPRNTGCRFDVPAAGISEALSQDGPTDGDPFQSKCGDAFRNGFSKLIEVMTDGAQQQPGNATGYPDFTNWPRWNDISHQKMWWEWIARARDGGLRVMVALAHNSRLLAETVLVGHPGGPISGFTDDENSADLQIREITALVNHHTDVMELAMTSSDLYNIVKRGHIAVVLGIEVDNLGDFNDKQPVNTQMIDNEINRLYQNGVRYIFPIHLTDNVFGDTALYDDLFNMANFRETGRFWTVGCSRPGDQVSWHSFGVPPGFPIPPGVPAPPQAPNCPGAGSPDPNATGNVNVRTPGGLTSLGQYAIKSMMKHGMIVDIDHMSNAAVDTALGIAESVPKGGYPVMSGHSGVRSTANFNKENSRTPAQLKRIACLGGMFGLGTDGAKATDWAREYAEVFGLMNSAFTPGGCTNASLGTGIVAFGTDMNSLVKSPRPTLVEIAQGDAPRYSDIYNANNPNNRDNPFLPILSRSQSGTRTWDYNLDGVAHYGMLADFVRDVRITGTPAMGGKELVDNHLLHGADYFYRMWQKIESQKVNVQ